MMAISARQTNILDFISRFWNEQGYPPTVRDIVHGCGISSTSVVDYNLDKLEREGFIRRHAGISRGIELVSARHSIAVPLAGQIAAGEPIPVPAPDAWDNMASADTIEVTADLTRGNKKVYGLRVKGLSMIDALINDGDLVLLKPTEKVENGETAAVWLKNEKEVTLKKVYFEPDGKVRLQPANSRMKPIYTTPDNVQIQGKVIAVIRKLA